ncbi:MAG: hypothetical protein RLZZ514_440, partial [Actinomycetota bacterium]
DAVSLGSARAVTTAVNRSRVKLVFRELLRHVFNLYL